jgi:alcohol dehydrogenase (cytochrome c)
MLGLVVWDRAISDPELGDRIGKFEGQWMTSGPLIVRGKVMIGTSGRREGGNYIVALDANTGQEVWRFYTIARPNERGGNSWNGLPLDKRSGAVGIPGATTRSTTWCCSGRAIHTIPARSGTR